MDIVYRTNVDGCRIIYRWKNIHKENYIKMKKKNDFGERRKEAIKFLERVRGKDLPNSHDVCDCIYCLYRGLI